MPRGPKGEKRKADVIGNAVHVMRIATGQEQDEPPKPKGALAVAACCPRWKAVSTIRSTWMGRPANNANSSMGAPGLNASMVSACRIAQSSSVTGFLATFVSSDRSLAIVS